MKQDLKLRDLRSLQELLDDLEWETELIGEETDYPSLAAVLPVEEDCDERAVFTYIDLPDEDSEFTKYLQIYLQIPLKIDRIPAGELIVTSVEDCARQECRYFHIVADDLDTLLDRELNHRP